MQALLPFLVSILISQASPSFLTGEPRRTVPDLPIDEQTWVQIPGHKKTDRIIHGRPASIGEFPYQVSLEMMYMHMCGGSIVHPQIILTAAHCMSHLKAGQRVPAAEMRVRVGADIAERDGVVHNVKTVVPHPGYDDDAPVDSNDLGIVFLEKPIHYTDKVKAVKLPERSARKGEIAWVTGYGSQKIQLRSMINPRQLMAVELPIVETGACRTKLKKKGGVVAKGMICAGHLKGRQDACKGDSGGPLVIDGTLYGVTAWGLGCGQEGTPGVYTDLHHYRPWIKLVSEALIAGKNVTNNNRKSKVHTIKPQKSIF